MNRKDYWSPETNPETGEKFARVLEYFHTAHNGSADIASMIDSPYGEACARRMQLDSIAPEASIMDIDLVDPYNTLFFSICY